MEVHSAMKSASLPRRVAPANVVINTYEYRKKDKTTIPMTFRLPSYQLGLVGIAG
jgi:hypothetical protein